MTRVIPTIDPAFSSFRAGPTEEPETVGLICKVSKRSRPSLWSSVYVCLCIHASMLTLCLLFICTWSKSGVFIP